MASRRGAVSQVTEADEEAPSSPDPKASLSEMRLPLFALGLLRATEAIAWTSIFPYVYPMIQSFPGVDETDIPFYAGLLVAVFTFCEFLSGMVWARVSDKIGRKPALLIGAICGMITSLSLGISRSLALAIASRAFGGLFNPNVGLVQTCVVELAEEKEHRAKALSFVTFLRSMGNLVGPVLGGFLADPAGLYPSVFPPSSPWTTYRFLLPNLAVAFLQAASFVVALLFLSETHPQLSQRSVPRSGVGQRLTDIFRRLVPRKRVDEGQYIVLPNDDPGPNEVEGGHDLEHASSDPRRDHIGKPDLEDQPRKAFTLQVILQIVSVSLLAFHKVSSDAIIPTFLAAPPTPSESDRGPRGSFETPGGFGYGNQKVGVILLTQAIVALVTQATLVPFFIDRVGTIRAYRIVLGIYPAMYIFTPLLPKLISPVSLVFMVLDLWIKVILSSIGYICSAILIANVAPTKTLLARINGASASFSCLSRSLGPIVTGKIFAVGLERGYAGIAFWTLGVVALLGAAESIVLRDFP